MNNISNIVLTITLCSIISASVMAQTDSTHDIRHDYLEYLLKPNATSLMDQFQHTAVSLFLNGTKPSIEIMKNKSQALVGVCLKSDRHLFPENRDIEFNLYSMRYKDFRDYTGKGHDGFANFYVKSNNDQEKKLVERQ